MYFDGKTKKYSLSLGYFITLQRQYLVTDYKLIKQ